MADVDDLDEQTDVPLDTIAALVRVAIESDVGGGALKSVWQDPRDLLTLPASNLPALAIYRLRERRIRLTEDEVEHVITVTFEYIVPATGLQHRENRYPALQEVWRALSSAMLEGSHEGVEDGAKVLTAAGCNIDEDAAEVSYGFADPGNAQSYPRFVGSMVVRHNPDEVDASTLDNFLKFYATWDMPEAAHDEEGINHDEPMAQTIITDLEAAD